MALTIDLENKKAFVSGCARGIGLGIARALAMAGCDVAGCGMREADHETVQAFIQEIEGLGRKALYIQGDLSKPEVPELLMQTLADQWGSLDVLISNAGRNIFKGAELCSEGDWDECMNLDLASHWRLSKAALPLFRASESQEPSAIVIIGSNHANNTIPGCFPYNVAKAGLLGLVQSLAIEWGPQVRCAGVAPGFIDTPGNDGWFDSFPDPAAERKRTEDSHPVGKIGSVEEIGALCAFLASAHGGFISGTTLLVDGGRSALMQDT
ncbi:MAG: SDR family oxidoreductase [Opitutae bacterium]|nr:SDR family oxidoreductase [Opitutae bacterium]